MKLKMRRISVVIVFLIGVIVWLFVNPESYEVLLSRVEDSGAEEMDGSGEEAKEGELKDGAREGVEAREWVSGEDVQGSGTRLAAEVLGELEVKGRAPKTGYSREQFYDGWPKVDGCSLRQKILKRELGDTAKLDGCNVIAGEYDEPYTGEHVVLSSREDVSKIQIDHVVALSDAWQKGAQYMPKEVRGEIATDPLNLLAVDGVANKQKSDGDAATWLPKNKKIRCQYVARQISVKYKYSLWVTSAEKEAMANVLVSCPGERVIGI